VDIRHVEQIHHAADEEISQVFFLRARKYNARLWIEFLCGQKRGQGIEIRIDMGRNDRLGGGIVGLGQGGVRSIVFQFHSNERAQDSAAADVSAYHNRY